MTIQHTPARNKESKRWFNLEREESTYKRELVKRSELN
jgi:hypothetical protein